MICSLSCQNTFVFVKFLLCLLMLRISKYTYLFIELIIIELCKVNAICSLETSKDTENRKLKHFLLF
jgi:hypothetical protein